MFSFDPLQQFHSLLRLSGMAGYPGLSYANPHPYEMSMQMARGLNRFPFRYQRGRMVRNQFGPTISGTRFGRMRPGTGAGPVRLAPQSVRYAR
jgi:hypothetical protein